MAIDKVMLKIAITRLWTASDYKFQPFVVHIIVCNSIEVKMPKFSLAMVNDTPMICEAIARNTVVQFMSIQHSNVHLNHWLLIWKINLRQPFLYMYRNPHIHWRPRLLAFASNHIVRNRDSGIQHDASVRHCSAMQPSAGKPSSAINRKTWAYHEKCCA